MVPKPEPTMKTDVCSEPTCEELYGPYPRNIPVPFVNADEETPPAEKVAAAKTMFDLKEYPDYRDVGTPDEWVPRDGRLVRLTGRHPFNVEPPLYVLNQTRFHNPVMSALRSKPRSLSTAKMGRTHYLYRWARVCPTQWRYP